MSALRGFDAVVFLTFSDWFREMRSNRYHFATRFARHLPVFFVQPDEFGDGFRWEETSTPNISVLHVGRNYDLEQLSALNAALNSRGVRAPLLWVYNFNFVDFVESRRNTFVVYHATEDYFCDDFFRPPAATASRERLIRLLRITDLLVSVSEGVEENYRSRGQYQGRSLVSTNGCDFAFWQGPPRPTERPTAIYQGGIHRKLDFELLSRVVEALPHWDFRFCGEVSGAVSEWKQLIRRKNVCYLGNLSPEAVREQLWRATVGIIPFVQNDWIVRRAFPLKAFEYCAAGLPVVTTPIDSLRPFGDVFREAADATSFVRELTLAAEEREESAALERRLAAARQQDYDIKFDRIVASLGSASTIQGRNLRIGVAYDPGSTHVSAIDEHLRLFSKHSRNEVSYFAATRGFACPALELFDVVVVHYSVRLSIESHFSEDFLQRIGSFGGARVLFIQDEYDTTETARRWMERLDFDLVYTCVPEESVEDVYPSARFPKTRFVPTLTGYAPIDVGQDARWRPLCDRRTLIGYRGRDLPFWYGDLGQEKIVIAQRMQEYCRRASVSSDIEWTSDKRIYGSAWRDFVASSWWTLGTESGCNVFDFDGRLSKEVRAAQLANPSMSYAEARRRFPELAGGRVQMNQISPRLFEAIELGTGLILFEGRYSDMLIPHEHYIPLKKDFSNVEAVIALAKDESTLENFRRAAYRDVIGSGRNSDARFAADFDDACEKLVRGRPVRSRMLQAALGTLTQARVSPATPSLLRAPATALPLGMDEARTAQRHFVEVLPHSREPRSVLGALHRWGESTVWVLAFLTAPRNRARRLERFAALQCAFRRVLSISREARSRSGAALRRVRSLGTHVAKLRRFEEARVR
jgi:glycosyltransferase involved in cell wall biosynthesis